MIGQDGPLNQGACAWEAKISAVPTTPVLVGQAVVGLSLASLGFVLLRH